MFYVNMYHSRNERNLSKFINLLKIASVEIINIVTNYILYIHTSIYKNFIFKNNKIRKIED